MPIYGIMDCAGLAAGLLFSVLAFAIFVATMRGGRASAGVLYLVGMILLSVGLLGFFIAWEMTNVRIPPGG